MFRMILDGRESSSLPIKKRKMRPLTNSSSVWIEPWKLNVVDRWYLPIFLPLLVFFNGYMEQHNLKPNYSGCKLGQGVVKLTRGLGKWILEHLVKGDVASLLANWFGETRFECVEEWHGEVMIFSIASMAFNISLSDFKWIIATARKSSGVKIWTKKEKKSRGKIILYNHVFLMK